MNSELMYMLVCVGLTLVGWAGAYAAENRRVKNNNLQSQKR